MVLSMERWKGKVAIVTGASAGIGAAIAEKLVHEGIIVVGLARRTEPIETLAKNLRDKPGALYAYKTDISKEEDVLAAFKWTKDNLGSVHILVNNAGCTRDTNLMAGDAEKWREIFETNVLGLCVATREAIKDMTANKVDGHIVHINSVAGHMVPNIPQNNVYPASKFAVTGLTETLRQELNSVGSNIKITSVSPGAVKTDFIKASGMAMTPHLAEVLRNIPWLQGEDVADAVAYVLATPPHVQVHELMLRGVGQHF